MADQIRDWLVARYPSPQSESPIEALLFAGWQLMAGHRLLPAEAALRIKQQAPVGKYRADFLFAIKTPTGDKRLVVEVDGHDFHERTKQQATHDKVRDRWMTGNGYDVIRFTGSEVWANPLRCADEISDRLCVHFYGRSQKESKALAGFAAIKALLDL